MTFSGVTITFVDPEAEGSFGAAIQDNTKCTEEELLDQGIKPNTIRLSIGIEKAEDLIAALDAAFDAVK